MNRRTMKAKPFQEIKSRPLSSRGVCWDGKDVAAPGFRAAPGTYWVGVLDGEPPNTMNRRISNDEPQNVEGKEEQPRRQGCRRHTSLPSELASEGEGRGGAGAASGVATSHALGSPFLLLMMESDVATRGPSLTLPLASLGRELLLTRAHHKEPQNEEGEVKNGRRQGCHRYDQSRALLPSTSKHFAPCINAPSWPGFLRYRTTQPPPFTSTFCGSLFDILRFSQPAPPHAKHKTLPHDRTTAGRLLGLRPPGSRTVDPSELASVGEGARSVTRNNSQRTTPPTMNRRMPNEEPQNAETKGPQHRLRLTLYRSGSPMLRV